MAASEAAKDGIHLSYLMRDLGFPLDGPMDLATDNQAARALSYNPEHHDRTKHIDRRHFFIRELVEHGRMSVPFVRTDDNLADFLTKPLDWPRFRLLRDRIMNVPEKMDEHVLLAHRAAHDT